MSSVTLSTQAQATTSHIDDLETSTSIPPTKKTLPIHVEYKSKRKIKLGAQPNWAGTEECKTLDAPIEFISKRIEMSVEEQLIKHGYAVVRLSEAYTKHYSDFHSVFEEFVSLTEDEKLPFASLQFRPERNSPNQLHGMSVVSGLKEQFMYRVSNGPELTSPGVVGSSSSIDFGVAAAQLYQDGDLLCRNALYKVGKVIGCSVEEIDKLLDPLPRDFHTKGVSSISKPFRDKTTGSVVSNFMIPGFVSSSILDTFHYFNTFSKTDQSHDKFFNNHASHTDSGMLTVVVCTDVPGLEVYDQDLHCWFTLEKYLAAFAKHEAIKNGIDDPRYHRRFAQIFWSDSHGYIKQPHTFKSCVHRVGKAPTTRISVVYKQRTLPITTACRYQEDFHLAKLQMDSIAAYKKSETTGPTIKLVEVETL